MADYTASDYEEAFAYDFSSPDAKVDAGYFVGAFETPVDATAPVVSNVSPAAGSTIDADTPIEFDVTDNEGTFARVFVSVLNEDTGVEEVAHDGDAWNGLYVASSTRTLIGAGMHYVLLREGGWPGSSMSLRVRAIDSDGNEGTA